MFVVCFSLNSLAKKEKKYITFYQENKKASFQLSVPLKCRMYRTDAMKRTGRIMKVVGDYIYFEYKDYDSTDVNSIMAMDLSRKEKYDLIDTMIAHSKTTEVIHSSKLTMLSVLSRDDRTSTKWLMLAGSVGFMGSAITLLISTSNSVGEGLKGWNYIQMAGVGSSAGLMAALVKHNIDMRKWKVRDGGKK